MTAISTANPSRPENDAASQAASVNRGKPSVGAARKAEIRKAATEFQSLFVEMMLKSMRETAKQDKLTGGGHGDEIYSSLLDREYATAISRRGNLGLAEMIEKQLLEQESGSAGNITTPKTEAGNNEASHEN